MRQSTRHSALFVILIGILLLATGCRYFENKEDHKKGPDRHSRESVSGENISPEQKWFQDAKFGMFIHWGIYSVLEDGEWVMNDKKIPVPEYEKLAARFNPVKYNPAEWVSLAKRAGMKYITITSRHHDGFSMWDSKVSDYNVVKRTPYGKDVLKMLADECQKQGMKLSFYYSHLDWHHPDYYPLGATGLHTGREPSGDFNKYVDFMLAQLKELLSGDYGPITCIWFDGWWDQNIIRIKQLNRPDAPVQETQIDWRLDETYRLIHSLQPKTLIGNNHHLAPFPDEDIQMFEKDLPGKNTATFNQHAQIGRLPLETCETMNKSWGYNKNDHAYKSTRELIHYLVRAAGHNANFLLNVGPRPDGTIQPEFVQRLEEIGHWMKHNGESIYGTRGGPVPPQPWGVTTRKDDKIFVHILEPPAGNEVVLPDAGSLKIKSAILLHGKGEVKISTRGNDVVLSLPSDARDPIDTIIVLK